MQRSQKTDDQLEAELHRMESGLEPLSWLQRASVSVGVVLPVLAALLTAHFAPGVEGAIWLCGVMAIALPMVALPLLGYLKRATKP